MVFFNEIFSNNVLFYILCGLIAASLFFLITGIKELKQHCFEGSLYIIIAFFLLAVHILYIFNLPLESPVSFILSDINIWSWAVLIFAPALIILFIIVGLLNFLFANFRMGILKIFFGLTLLFYLYIAGANWAVDIKGIITFVWCLIWFEVELRTAK